MKVVASMNNRDMLLIIPGDDYKEARKAAIPIVRVLWRSRKWLMRPSSLNGHMKQGNWEADELPDGELHALLSDLERVDGSAVYEPWVITPWQPPDAQELERMALHKGKLRTR